QIFDDSGKDVTPQPLFHLDPNTIHPKQSKLFSSQDATVAHGSEMLSSISIQQTGATASFVGPFTRSTFGSSSISKSSQSTLESMTEETEESIVRRDVSISLSDYQVRREVREPLTEESLNKIVAIYLTETETMELLDMPAVMVSVETEEAQSIREKNEAYMMLCKNRAGNDQYVERMMQTFDEAPKNKEVQCEKINIADADIAVMATTWDMYDTFNSEETIALSTKAAVGGPVSQSQSKSSSQMSLSRGQETGMSKNSFGKDSYSSTIIDVDNAIVAQIPEEEQKSAEEILKSEKFQQDLFVMERILMQNVFQPRQASYRQLPVLTVYIRPVQPKMFCTNYYHNKYPDYKPEVSENEEFKAVSVKTKTPSLDRLWSFTCELTKGHNVSSMAWNKKNLDILAVGYGQFDFKEQKGGLACCWSLKNPVWPERIFHFESGVTALDFSEASPSLLAVGLYDGTVAICNVQSNQDTPVLDSSDCNNKHIGPVWELKWIEQDRGTTGDDKGEVLISISADGRVTKWHIRKGLDSSDLMKLKRTGNEKIRKLPGDKEKKSEAFISRQAPGMCFDFHPKDTNIYLAGTEEGQIHKCSCSYNEQFLDTYKAHKGPVYKIAWSPFAHDVFLSCSADWSIFLWRQDLSKPVLSFYSTTKAVHSIRWSPKSATLFGTVNEGRVEIWDLSVSILDPIVVSSAGPGAKLTTLLFAQTTDCVLIGDSDGQVSVYELENI
uniref:Dynein axonemal intermediate chain 4 n=1 Tax=Latimeria chalumnae TaxID=7897 RepID=H3AVV7_LATCH